MHLSLRSKIDVRHPKSAGLSQLLGVEDGTGLLTWS